MGLNLKEARKLAGCTQGDLSDACGITQSRISEFERGARVPETPTLIKLARALNCSTDYLLGLSDNPKGEATPDAPSAWDKMFEGKEGEPSGIVASLNDQIKALQARLEYQEKLIAEKDKRIEGLETLVTVLRELKKGKR